VVTRWLLVVVILVGTVLAAPLWLPWFGMALAVNDPLAPADVALVLEGTGADAIDTAEALRQQSLVRDVVIVEAPIKTHALIAYWSDFVRWGLAEPSPTPPDHLQVVRSPTTQASEQARAALPALQDLGASSVLVLGGGGIGSRLVERGLTEVFAPAAIDVRLISHGGTPTDVGRWYLNAFDRRAVLDSWLQLLVPFLSGT
jgi:hypothetical protein